MAKKHARRSAKAAPAHRLPRIPRQLIRWVLLSGLGLYGLCFLSFVYLKFLPPLSTIVHVQRRIESHFTSAAYTKRYTVVPLERIAPALVHSTIASEDTRFHQHIGIDWIELRKVLTMAWERGQFGRGASTITQQLVKNVLLTSYGSVFRKAAEFVLVPVAELVLSKHRIIELYLNVVEWGPGVYGAQAAARYHYGISAAQLSREQAARLVACLPAPHFRQPQLMDETSQTILIRMDQMGL
jgi:monofunctional biosynthetic peptidoglycan transglycosylase